MDTMASASFPRVILAICLSLLTVPWVSAQTVSPSNDTSGVNSTVQFILDTTLSMMETHANIDPLTNDAGLTGSLSQLEQISPTGPLVLTNSKTVESLSPGNIAYISCEPSDYTGSIDSSRTINLAVNNKPYAIVLYSVYASSCNFSPSNNFAYTSLYTMTSANASAAVVAGLNKNNPPSPQTQIHVDQSTVNGTSNGGGNILGRSPTTAVAMIILYSITGIITALFLIIIIVGAIRAHRHPERYGPRRAQGRPRQSRAKGIARAMLETLPIVKFGDREDDKPADQGRDVELAPTDAENTPSATADAPAEVGPDVVTTEAAAGSTQPKHEAGEGDNTDNGLACSVCTDDFVKGQDIRVLPCKHKFHPECIDPWLLNVSGTCPLCRVDLHPTTSHDSDADADAYEPTLETLPTDITPATETTITESTHRNRRSRIIHTLNIGRMRQATPEERIAALRRLRNEDQATDSSHEQGGRPGGVSRIGARLGRALGSLPGSGAASRRVSAVPTSRPISEVPQPAEASDPIPETNPGRTGSFTG